MTLKERLEKLADRLYMDGQYVDENIVREALDHIYWLEQDLSGA